MFSSKQIKKKKNYMGNPCISVILKESGASYQLRSNVIKMIYLYSGNGGGKSTSALGLVLRSLGHSHNVLVIQFMKWFKETGEYKFRHPNYEIIQCGREGWHGVDNLTDEDKEDVKKGLWSALMYIQAVKNIRLLVLDEINLAVHYGLTTDEEVLHFLDYIPLDINIIMTGRHASQKLMDRADFVNIITSVKSPKEMVCQEGVQY